jgi:sulfotransferase
VIETSQEGPGMKFEVPVERRKNTLLGLFEGFYKHIEKPVVFNTNRAWTLLTPQMRELFPKAKMIVCVRDVNWILDSFETAHRNNPLTVNTITGSLGESVYSRINTLMDEKGIVGFPYIGIKQAITGNEKNMLMLIEYNDLCKNPERTMRSIYGFIDQEYYTHDFDNVEASWDEYDSEIGIKLHQVRKRVEFKHRQSILPPDILQKYTNMEVWRL